MHYLDRQLPSGYRLKLVATVQLVVATALTAGFFVVGFAAGPSMQKVLLWSLGFVLLSIYLTRRGFDALGSVVFLATILTMTVRFAWSGQGINDIAFAILPLLFVISGMILTLRRYLFVVPVVVSTVLVVATATHFGYVPMHSGFQYVQDMWVDAIGLVIILLAEAALVFVLVKGLLLAFVDAEQKQQALQSAQESVLRLNAELEQRVRERTVDLQQLLEEREAFNYTVSHDLRAPLRAVIGFTQAALDEFGSDPEAAVAYLQRVVHAGHRMNNLIDDLLRLSRASTTPLRLEKIALSPLLDDILRESIEPKHVAIELHDEQHVSVMADRGLLQQLLTNLISNAVKYSSARSDANVAITIQQNESSITIAIRDNGIGFNSSDAERLFKPFSRLDNASQIEGTGIGLAIVKRIVERHNGQISAEAELNKGAVFTVTLPR